MYLLIDYREKDFIHKLSELTLVTYETVKTVMINNCEVQFKVTNLPIADFIITTNLELANNKHEDQDCIKVAIERKSINDLCSSITDGRFREQKTRLLDSIGDNSKICYFIEGSKSKARMSNTIINGAILNLIYKHRYTVISTENKDDTFFTTVSLYKKWLNKEYELVNSSDVRATTETNDQNERSEPMKLLKRSDKINSDKFIHQLCLVPGVSMNIAKIIYSNMSNNQNNVTLKYLIEIYNSVTEEEAQLYFSEMIISDKNGRIRKVGKALSKKIYSYFCN